MEEASTMAEITPGPTEFANAEVYLPKGDRNEIAKVLGRKRNLEGLYIGRKHANPKLDCTPKSSPLNFKMENNKI